MRRMKNAARGLFRSAYDKGGEVAIWALCNRKKALAVGGALLGAFLLVSMLTHPGEAEAIPVIPVIVGVAAVGAGLFAAGEAAEGISELLRGWIVSMLAWAQSLVSNTASGTLLTSTFETLLGDEGIHSALYNLHHVAVIPLGNIVAATFLVFGLVKIISKAGQTDAGIDVWQFIMLFVFYGAATTLVNASWEIMYALFNLAQAVISRVLVVSQAAMTLSDPTEGIENAGLLAAMLVVSVIVVLVSLIVCGLSHAVVIVRAIQIYIYTVFSPVPLAFMVSEGGREMTKSFAKKYAALLLSGALLALLFFMFSLALSAVPIPDVEITDTATFAEWATLLVLNYIVFYGAFGYAVFKSGAWSRDLLGV